MFVGIRLLLICPDLSNENTRCISFSAFSSEFGLSNPAHTQNWIKLESSAQMLKIMFLRNHSGMPTVAFKKTRKNQKKKLKNLKKLEKLPLLIYEQFLILFAVVECPESFESGAAAVVQET